MAKKKTWKEKLLDSKDLPKVEQITEKQEKIWGIGTVVIPAPLEVDEIMRQVPYGKLITINLIRERLAIKHDATTACPITTGIFAWIAANAADEAAQAGIEDITPYWRTLKTGGELNEKYHGGIENQKKLLEAEGHRIVQKGKKFIVENYQEKLVEV